ncbi:MAG: polysaccharide biosynthesis tyrosine autokinase [Kiritimatiellae bacterium]|nr:polysaccharide biosynthesis tyrosine autokinase [Kiritimatiellia bacterium]
METEETSDQAGSDTAGTQPSARNPRQEGSRSPAYYYGRQPVYGGGAAYGYGGMAGNYGMPYYAGGEGDSGGDSLLGSLTLQRVLRVITQKWPTLVVAVLLGLGGGFAYYKTAPVSYKAFSTIEMQVWRPRVMPTPDVLMRDPNTQGSSDEIFNTRLAKLRSRELIKKVRESVRAEFPALKDMADREVDQMLYEQVEFTLQRRSRLVLISARHGRADVAAAIANAYARTAEDDAMAQNKAESDRAVAFLGASRDANERLVDKARDSILKFRVDNDIDVMENKKKALDAALQLLSGELARAESEQKRASELLALLNTIQKTPDKIGPLPEVVPRASEIAQAQQALQNAIVERDAKLLRYTDKHPEVVDLNNTVEVCRKQYMEAVWRARDTAVINLDVVNTMLKWMREEKGKKEKESAELGEKIVSAQVELDKLTREYQISEESYRAILRRMEELRLASDESSATVKVVEEALPPQRPVSPDPRVAFSTGPAVGLLLGLLFILLLDRLEDRVTSTADIEQHMSTKVLALIPHVPRVKRDDLVTMSANKKFSRLAEAFAGLRGLLESPRYRDLSQVMLVVSTQPEEGKTITSGNLAMTYAMAGQKTVLVDFDLRRPRIGRVFKVKEHKQSSLVDVLDAGDPAAFATLPMPSGYENLDLVTSRASAHISPASIMGSGIVPQFFEWARKRYTRVIVDSPPFGLVSDAVVLGTLSDGVILVCRPDRSRYRAIRHAIRQFMESGARLLGVVVNDVDFGRSSAFSNYDYRNYGYGYNSRYGRYGRYGYGYGGYYKRSLDNVTPAAGQADSGAALDEGDEAPAPAPSVLDVDDEE